MVLEVLVGIVLKTIPDEYDNLFDLLSKSTEVGGMTPTLAAAHPKAGIILASTSPASLRIVKAMRWQLFAYLMKKVEMLRYKDESKKEKQNMK